MNRKIPTKTQLIELVKKYKTNQKIGEVLGGVPAYLVSYWLRKKNVPKIAEPKFSRFQIQSVWEETGSDSKAGAQLGISKTAFYRWRRVHGITEKPKAIKLHQLDLGIGLSRRDSYTKATVTEQVLSAKLKGKEFHVGDRLEFFPDQAVVGFLSEEITDWQEVERLYPIALFEYSNPLQRSAPRLPRMKERPNERVFSATDGVFHQLLFEERIPRPFELVAYSGYHLSALGATGAAVFPTEREAVISGTRISVTVPKVYQIVLSGKLPTGCTVTDLVLYLQKKIPADWDPQGAVEMLGDGVDALSPEQRFNLANMAGELPFQSAIVAAQKPLVPFPRLGDWEVGRLEIHLPKTEPQIYRYPEGKTGEILATHLGKPVERVFIGGCQNGCLEDLELAAKLLEDRTIASGVELSIFPASRTVYRRALRKGILDAFVAAGAMIYPPGSYPVSWNGKIFATMDKACLDYVKPENVFAGSFLVGLASALTGELTDPKTLFH